MKDQISIVDIGAKWLETFRSNTQVMNVVIFSVKMFEAI